MIGRTRALATRIGLGCAVLVLLLYPWPVLRSVYASCFRTCGQAVLQIAGVPVEFRTIPRTEDGVLDTQLIVADPAHRGGWSQRCSSWFVGLIPTAIFIGLWICTRLPRAASLRALLLGMLCIQGFVLVRLVLLLLSGWTIHAQERPEHAHPAFLGLAAWRGTMRALLELHYDPIAYVLVPVLIWVVIALRLRTRPPAGSSEQAL